MAIQGAFGWENCHLFQFCNGELSDGVCYGVLYDEEDVDHLIDAKKTKMGKLFKQAGQSYTYVYDFGDYWKHRLTLEKIEAKDMSTPYCLEGAGACPPEDVGGMHGYEEMLEAFRMPRHPEKARFKEWLCFIPGEKWVADYCSIREVNKRLCLLE
jgi:hypothetical protein